MSLFVSSLAEKLDIKLGEVHGWIMSQTDGNPYGSFPNE